MSNKNDQKNRKEWLKLKANFSKDELLIKGFQVMQKWEDNYMKELAKITTSKGGNVLELGFGMGISAGYIQKSKKIKSHTVIEAHPEVVEQAIKRFRKEIVKGRLILLNSFWENMTPKLKDGLFDGILFDTSPLDKETVFFHYFPFFKEAHRLLKKGGIFTYFSDEPKEFSKKHMVQLKKAGFSKINFKICKVNPPPSCRYWKHNTIISPIIYK